MRNTLSKPVNGYGLTVMLVVCLSLAGVGLATNIGQIHESERKFCALIGNSHVRAQRAADAFVTSPPVTEAGRRQRDETIIALSQLRKLERDLGCPPGRGEASK